MSKPPFIRLDGVSKSWGGNRGVECVDLAIDEGEFVVLLGPSGCGKSTTLRMIAGLETPDTGRVVIAGRDITAEPPAARGLSMVFQSYALFPHLTVADNITFGLSVRRVPRRERQDALAKAVSLTGLAGLEGRKPAALSGGQRQRVALARAIVAGHPICLMDEPLSNLDAKLRHAVRQDIRALQRELGMTVVYVTHDQTEAMGMADRIVLMNGGRVEQADTPDALYLHPDTAFAATFLGSPPMVLMPAASVPERLLPQGAPRALSGLDIGIRPEAISLAEPAPHRHRATVRDAEFLGAETLVYLTTGTGEAIARLPGRLTIRAGEPVGIDWAPGAATLFERATGKRLAPPAREYRHAEAGASHGGSAPPRPRDATGHPPHFQTEILP
ncbi:ABC transporter ATP-binding protein [Pleomorphomonas sp. JP5]|uniref:ABC transporter ATP-binding protein n=1 Tax=Pleomorphomonas sp. JP5 TaxID=2942998 RepID=UPI002044475C|nr:ABC transporter ATP-binding protein [Pleomorphomonas sp. JP5]MCM5557586.1 ABC transporter ATP-binding protein [Pleomorphomonas sp. JP5]